MLHVWFHCAAHIFWEVQVIISANPTGHQATWTFAPSPSTRISRVHGYLAVIFWRKRQKWVRMVNLLGDFVHIFVFSILQLGWSTKIDNHIFWNGKKQTTNQVASERFFSYRLLMFFHFFTSKVTMTLFRASSGPAPQWLEGRIAGGSSDKSWGRLEVLKKTFWSWN